VSSSRLQALRASRSLPSTAAPAVAALLPRRSLATATTTAEETDLESTPTNFMLSPDLVSLRDYVRRIAIEKVGG